MERVKLYYSTNEDDWEDKGTGFLKFDTLDTTDKAGFVITSEEDSSVLLTHEIGVTAQGYTLQADSRIIRWAEPELENHHALSFENEGHCKEVFGKLQKVQSKEEAVTSNPAKPLPDLTLTTLESMTKMFEDVQPFTKDQLFSRLHASGFIPQLVQVFQQCEDLEDVPSLENCCRLARTLVLHADFSTAEALFSEEHALHIIGALEYDPDIPVRIKHRQFLRDRVSFKEVVPITDLDTVRRIHRIYRMQYVKDVVLPRLMDEPVYSCLSHMIMMGHMDVVNALSVQQTFFSDLFTKIQKCNSATEEWNDLVGFLQEYCLLLRQLPPANQQAILIKMHKLGLFDVLTDVLRDGNAEVKLKAIDILNSSMAQDPSALRGHICSSSKHPLLKLLLDNLVEGDAMGLTEQSLEVIKALLEPSENAANKYDSFLEIFYGSFMNDLVETLAVGLDEKTKMHPEMPETVSARAKNAILDLLSLCVQTHQYSVKYYMLRGNTVERVSCLLRAPEKWLVASTVRFFRTLVGMKEEFYDRIVIRANALGMLVDVFFENGDRNNLLNSTILELFDFLRRERRHIHIEHVVEHYYDRLKDVRYVTTFEEMRNEYDKKREGGCSLDDITMLTATNSRMKRDTRAMEKEEEDYFAEGSDDTEKMPDVSQGSRMEEDTTSEEKPDAAEHHAKRLKGDEATVS